MTEQITKEILKEYEQTRQKHARELEKRRAMIDSRIPELAEVESRISSLFIERARARVEDKENAPDDVLRQEIERLNEEKRLLLITAGFSPEDLDLSYTCEACRDTGYLDDGQMCACHREKLISRLYDLSGMKGVYEAENFHTFDYRYYPDDPKTAPDGGSARQAAKNACLYFFARFYGKCLPSGAASVLVCAVLLIAILLQGILLCRSFPVCDLLLQRPLCISLP